MSLLLRILGPACLLLTSSITAAHTLQPERILTAPVSDVNFSDEVVGYLKNAQLYELTVGEFCARRFPDPRFEATELSDRAQREVQTFLARRNLDVYLSPHEVKAYRKLGQVPPPTGSSSLERFPLSTATLREMFLHQLLRPIDLSLPENHEVLRRLSNRARAEVRRVIGAPYDALVRNLPPGDAPTNHASKSDIEVLGEELRILARHIDRLATAAKTLPPEAAPLAAAAPAFAAKVESPARARDVSPAEGKLIEVQKLSESLGLARDWPDDTPVTRVPLSIAVRHGLTLNGIMTVGELRRRHPVGFRACDRLGPKTLSQIERFVTGADPFTPTMNPKLLKQLLELGFTNMDQLRPLTRPHLEKLLWPSVSKGLLEYLEEHPDACDVPLSSAAA